MIVNSNLISQICVGVDGAIPQPADAQLEVPSAVLPALLFTSPLKIDPGSTEVNERSFLETNNFTHTNSATTSTTIAVLGRGLWEVIITLNARFNYDGALAGGDILACRFQDASSTVVHRIIQMLALTGQFTSFIAFRCLLQGTTNLQRELPTNGAGQTIQGSLSILANKIL